MIREAMGHAKICTPLSARTYYIHYTRHVRVARQCAEVTLCHMDACVARHLVRNQVQMINVIKEFKIVPCF